MRYRFDIVGTNALDVVSAAGGWLYDRVTAGWIVTVMILEEGDVRPLQVLGARTVDLASVLADWQKWPRPQTLAISAELFERHPLVHRGVLSALGHGRTEVTLWGAVPAELHREVDVRQHRLSTAARAFKAQALRAAAADPAPEVAGTEIFRCGMAACPSVAADLSPAS